MLRHMNERTTIRLPPDLLERAKRKAASEGRTLTSLIEDGLRTVLIDRRAAEKTRVMPRVSKAGGGLAPGIDLNDTALLQEVEDEERLERMKKFR